MNEVAAVNAAEVYAAAWNIPWRQVVKTDKEREWWFFSIRWYTFTIDTGDGEAIASVYGPTATVNRFEYYPSAPDGFLLPLWVAFPGYTSVTCGWRQGYGESYKYRWHSFYRSLTEAKKAEYRLRFPPPVDKDLCWQGFYENVADKPADGSNPIAEFIIGRVT